MTGTNDTVKITSGQVLGADSQEARKALISAGHLAAKLFTATAQTSVQHLTEAGIALATELVTNEQKNVHARFNEHISGLVTKIDNVAVVATNNETIAKYMPYVLDKTNAAHATMSDAGMLLASTGSREGLAGSRNLGLNNASKADKGIAG